MKQFTTPPECYRNTQAYLDAAFAGNSVAGHTIGVELVSDTLTQYEKLKWCVNPAARFVVAERYGKSGNLVRVLATDWPFRSAGMNAKECIDRLDMIVDMYATHQQYSLGNSPINVRPEHSLPNPHTETGPVEKAGTLVDEDDYEGIIIPCSI